MAKPFAFCALYHIKESCIKLKKVKRDHHPMNMSIGRETGLVNFKINMHILFHTCTYSICHSTMALYFGWYAEPEKQSQYICWVHLIDFPLQTHYSK